MILLLLLLMMMMMMVMVVVVREVRRREGRHSTLPCVSVVLLDPLDLCLIASESVQLHYLFRTKNTHIRMW